MVCTKFADEPARLRASGGQFGLHGPFGSGVKNANLDDFLPFGAGPADELAAAVDAPFLVTSRVSENKVGADPVKVIHKKLPWRCLLQTPCEVCRVLEKYLAICTSFVLAKREHLVKVRNL